MQIAEGGPARSLMKCHQCNSACILKRSRCVVVKRNKVTIVATYSKYKQAAAAYMSTSCAHTSCYFNTSSQIALQTFEYTENMPGS